jgi:hypothetical protein
MRLTMGGVFVYAGTALLLVVQAVRLVLLEALWADGGSVASVSLVVLTVATALLFGAGAVTRQPLIEGEGPWFASVGWAVVIALTAVGIGIALMTSIDENTALWVTGPAVFVPFWVRKLEESYREGVDEASRGQ